MDKSLFKPYDPLFPKLFETEKKRILEHVHNILAVEHIGSTAVPNLGGKGFIDIAIGSSKEHIDSISKELQTLVYEFRPDFSTEDRYYFVGFLPDPKEGTRRYHIHLTQLGSTDWEDFLAFRDHLRAHPETAQKYLEIKKTASLESEGIKKTYRKLKEPFIEKIKKSIRNK